MSNPETAKVSVTINQETEETAKYVPFYTQSRYAENVALPVLGNENSGMNETYD